MVIRAISFLDHYKEIFQEVKRNAAIEPLIPSLVACISGLGIADWVGGKGYGLQGKLRAASRICGCSAEWGSSVLVFDLHVCFCKVRGLRGLFSYFF